MQDVSYTSTFSIITADALKLAYKTTGENSETLRLFGQFSSALSDQEIEDKFGDGSSFAPTSFFTTGLATFHTIPQAALGAAFPAGSEVIVASNGLESLGIGFVQSNAGSASVAFLENTVGVVREAPLQHPDGIQHELDRLDARQDELTDAWIARLTAIKAQRV